MENEQPNSQQNTETSPRPTAADALNIPDISQITYDAPKNPNRGKIIALIVCAAILVIGMAIFLAIYNGTQTPSQTEPSKSSSNSDSKKEEKALTESEKQALVKDTLNSLKDALTDTTGEQNSEDCENCITNAYTVQDVYDTNTPIYLPSTAKAPMYLDKSFGFQIDTGENTQLAGELAENIVAKFKELGFSEYKQTTMNLNGDHGYINNTSNIICTPPASTSLSLVTVSCSHTSWYTHEEIALNNALAEAYKKKELVYPEQITAKPSEIKNSPYQPYQKIVASVGNLSGLFYRPSTDGEWVYFTSTQTLIPCSSYYTEAGIRHAFQGETCLDENGDSSTVLERN